MARAVGGRQPRRAMGAALLAAGTLLFWQQNQAFATTEPQSVSEHAHGLVGTYPITFAILAAALCAVLTNEEPVAPDAAVPVEKRADFGKICFMSFWLCLFSGMVNIVCFYETGFLVAHQSGNTCHMGRLAMAGGSFALIVLCFLIGAGVTGYCKSNGDAPIHGYYCPAMLAAGLATAFGVWVQVASKGEAMHVCTALLAFGQGMQNGVTTKFSSMPLRTTHHTGTITDAGSAIGLYLRAMVRGEAAPPMAKTAVLIVCFLGYAAGAFAATEGTHQFGIYAALPPALGMALVGFGTRQREAKKVA